MASLERQKSRRPKSSIIKMAKKTNPWLIHVKKTLAKHKGKPFKEILKIAKKTY